MLFVVVTSEGVIFAASYSDGIFIILLLVAVAMYTFEMLADKIFFFFDFEYPITVYNSANKRSMYSDPKIKTHSFVPKKKIL